MAVTRDLLLDKRNAFLPPALALFTKLAFFQPLPRFYWEFEVIWHAVSIPTWIKLQAQLTIQAWDIIQRQSILAQQYSHNLFSSKVRRNWKDSRDVRKERTEFDTLFCGAGLFIHMLRDKFISDFNAKHPNLDPPLKRGDNLRARLAPFGGLPTIAENRIQSQEETVKNSSQRE
ncbi:BQ5605_C001g00563 [Microbotryum silenes-dioicae]|uniref:BQ5605_C001g00563 protein n=1 Tax=Microbotryum silenes-dioicae TaxID=796604 RepID=A0A2X0M3Q9_9BASI|nr:BQ5605_C001g00563 [Microbotryum silenes-dioicae]